MTIEGAIVELQNLIDSEEIPFWEKPSLRKVKETVEDEREVRIALQEKQIVWHPYPKEKPTKGGLYLVTISNSKDRAEVRTYWYIDCEDGFGESFSRTLQIWTVTAWAEMPKPYGEGAEE